MRVFTSVVTATVFLATASGHATELRYSGTVTTGALGDSGTIVKEFSVNAIVTEGDDGSRHVFFVVGEKGGGGWAWPERFGLVTFDNVGRVVADQSRNIQLLHTHDGTRYPILLPRPFLGDPKKLTEGAEWSEGRTLYQIGRQRDVDGRRCREVTATSGPGRIQRMRVDTETALLVRVEQQLFMGRGDQFRLKMELDSERDSDDTTQSAATAALLALQRDLERRPDELQAALSPKQLEIAATFLRKVPNTVAPKSVGMLVADIRRDVASQQRTQSDLSSLAGRFVDHQAPKIELTKVNGHPIDAESLKDAILVLHFWEYSGDSLEEPYGQVGYLDFLSGKRRKLGVKVIGVASSERLNDPQTASAAKRSVRKLQEFMNLSYDIALDDGSLLQKFGSPQKLGAKLPLWVVIAPDGTVVHYKTGFYAIKPMQGLTELDDVVVEQIRAARAKSEE